MKKNFVKFTICLLGLCLPVSLLAAPIQKGKVIELRGTAEKEDIAGKKTPLKIGSPLFESEMVRTIGNSAMKISFIDKSEINLGPSSKMKVESMSEKSSGLKKNSLWLMAGKIRAKVPNEKTTEPKLFIKTNVAVMGIRGTDLDAVYNGDTGNSALVTESGDVAITKSDSVPPNITPNQAAAISKTIDNTVKAINDKLPPINAGTITQINNAAKQLEAQITPKVSQSEMKSVVDTSKVILNAITPDLPPAQLKAFGEVAKAIETTSNVTPEQHHALEIVKSAMDNALSLSTGATPTALSLEQSKAFSEVQKMTGEIQTSNMSPQAAQVLDVATKQVEATGKSFEAISKITPDQVKALEVLQNVQVTQNSNAVALPSASQTVAMAEMKDILKTVGTDILPPAQVQSAERVSQISDLANDKVGKVSMEQALAIEQVHNMSSAPKVETAGEAKMIQTIALMDVANALSAAPEKVPTPATAEASIQTLSQEMPLSLSEIQAVQAVSAFCKITASDQAPHELSASQVQMLDQTQNIAEKNIDPSKLQPIDQVAFMATNSVSNILNAEVKEPMPSPSQLVQTLADPEKSITVGGGQYSGVNASQELPSQPVKISPTQLEVLKSETAVGTSAGASIAGAVTSTATQRSEQAKAQISETTGKPVISPAPPGVDIKSVMGSQKEFMAAMNASGFQMPTTQGELPEKNQAGVPFVNGGSPGVLNSANTPQGVSPNLAAITEGKNTPPPEGMRDGKNVAPPAGGFLDMSTGLYVPPPPGSPFDAAQGVYMPLPSMGGLDSKTGNYVPPAGMALMPNGVFVTEVALNQSANHQGMNMMQAMMSSQIQGNNNQNSNSVGVVGGGNYGEQGMVSSPPPPGKSPDYFQASPMMVSNTSANSNYIPSNFVVPNYNAGNFVNDQGGTGGQNMNGNGNNPNNPNAQGNNNGQNGGQNGNNAQFNGQNGNGGFNQNGGQNGDSMGIGMDMGMGMNDGGMGMNGGMGYGTGYMDPNAGMGGYFIDGQFSPYFDPNTGQPYYPVNDPYACVNSSYCNPDNNTTNNTNTGSTSSTSVTVTIN